MTNVVKNSEEVSIHGLDIQIENELSIKAKLAWLYMLSKALPDFKNKNIFMVSINELKQAIDYTNKNNQTLKKILNELKQTNIIETVNKILEINSLLAGIRINSEANIIEYCYSPFLQEKLCNPLTYMKINLMISRKFKGKHNLAIYCLAMNSLYMKNNFGIKNFTVEEIRRYLGLKDNEYKMAGELLKHIIKKSETKINNNSDLKIKITPIRADREKIIGFQMEISIKEEKLYIYKSDKAIKDIISPKNEVSTHVKLKRKIIIKNEKLKYFFAANKISLTTDLVQDKLAFICETLGRDKLEQYLLFLMEYAEQENKMGVVKKLSGFYIGLLKDDTQIINYTVSLEQNKKNAEEKQSKIDHLLNSKISTRYESFISDDFRNYITSNIAYLEDKFIEIMTKTVPADSMVGKIIARNSKGKIDKGLITDSKTTTRLMIFSHLDNFKSDLGYISIPFEEWKSKTLNEAYINELKKELDKSLTTK